MEEVTKQELHDIYDRLGEIQSQLRDLESLSDELTKVVKRVERVEMNIKGLLAREIHRQ